MTGVAAVLFALFTLEAPPPPPLTHTSMRSKNVQYVLCKWTRFVAHRVLIVALFEIITSRKVLVKYFKKGPGGDH